MQRVLFGALIMLKQQASDVLVELNDALVAFAIIHQPLYIVWYLKGYYDLDS